MCVCVFVCVCVCVCVCVSFLITRNHPFISICPKGSIIECYWICAWVCIQERQDVESVLNYDAVQCCLPTGKVFIQDSTLKHNIFMPAESVI